MHKTTEILKKIISCVIISGFGAVTVLGLVWLVGNFRFACYSVPNMPLWVAVLLVITQILAVFFSLFAASLAFVESRIKCVVIALMITCSPFMLQTMLDISYRPWMIAAFFFFLSSIFTCREKKKLAGLIAYFTVAVILLVPVNVIRSTSLEDATLERLGSWHLFSTYGYIQAEGKVDIPYDILIEEHYTTNGARDVVIPYINNHYDKEQADEIKTYLAKLALRVHKKSLIREIAIDAGSYVFSPQFAAFKLQGKSGPSYVPNLVAKFVEATPVLGSICMKFFLWWSNISLILGMFSLFLWKRKRIAGWIAGGCASLIMICVYSLRSAGSFDYRDACFILSLWNLFILLPIMENLKLHDRD